jgi:hypothetical protein
VTAPANERAAAPGITREALRALHVRLHDRRFVTAGNPHGVSGADTVFHYRMDGAAITGTYGGGRIRTGHLVGRATGADTVALLYCCLTTDGELLAGWSRGRVGSDPLGSTTLTFEWGWLSGAEGGGESRYVELGAAAADVRGPEPATP